MGISIEKFRSRFGSHHNFLKTKGTLSRFKDRFWNIMLMMFYLNVFYLPILKQQSSDVLVYANDVLQCLYCIAYKTSK